MTNSWNDIKNTDLVLIMGGNAAEAHPCGFKWVTEAKANNGAKLIVVDPRFTRSAAVADVYAPIRPGTDIAFLSGVMRYLLANGKIHREYAKAYTNATYLVKEGFKGHQLLARQLMVLVDGAVAQMLLHRDPAYAQAAKQAAAALLGNARRRVAAFR